MNTIPKYYIYPYYKYGSTSLSVLNDFNVKSYQYRKMNMSKSMKSLKK